MLSVKREHLFSLLSAMHYLRSDGGNIGGNGGNLIDKNVEAFSFVYCKSIFAFRGKAVDYFSKVWYTNDRRKNSTRGEPFSHLTV